MIKITGEELVKLLNKKNYHIIDIEKKSHLAFSSRFQIVLEEKENKKQ